MSATAQASLLLDTGEDPFPGKASPLLNRGVLVLNRNWAAIHVCTVRRALGLVFEDLARIVSEDCQTYDFETWRDLSAMRDSPDLPRIHTPRYALLAPDVIVLGQYNRMPPRRVKFNRRNIFLRDGFTCQYCGTKPRRDDLTIDHVLPRSKGGRSTWENVILACVKCNTHKGDRTPVEAGMRLKRAPKRPHWLSCLNVVPGANGRTAWQRFVDNAYWNVDLRD